MQHSRRDAFNVRAPEAGGMSKATKVVVGTIAVSLVLAVVLIVNSALAA